VPLGPVSNLLTVRPFVSHAVEQMAARLTNGGMVTPSYPPQRHSPPPHPPPEILR